MYVVYRTQGNPAGQHYHGFTAAGRHGQDPRARGSATVEKTGCARASNPTATCLHATSAKYRWHRRRSYRALRVQAYTRGRSYAQSGVVQERSASRDK